MTTYYVDPIGGNNANAGTSFALRKKDLNNVTANAAGDLIRIMATPDKTDSGITATFTNKSLTVTLASSLTQLITNCDSTWTASTNVSTGGAGRKEGTSSASIAILAAFTTGKAAFFATGTLDLSAYQQISFWASPGSTVAAGVLRIDLCSDVAGATPVYSFTINRALSGTTWNAVTIDNGSVMSAATAIKSIALFCISDPGTLTIVLDDFIACNAPTATNCLTLNSLICAGSSGDPWPIKSINGTTVVIDTHTNSNQGVGRGWSGTTGSYELYIRQPQALASVATATTAVPGLTWAGVSGTSGSRVTVSGGWDTTNMSSQSGDTFYDGVDGLGNCTFGGSFIDFSKISSVRHNQAFIATGSGASSNTYTDLSCVGQSSSTFAQGGHANGTWTRCKTISCAADMFGAGSPRFTVRDCKCLSSTNFCYFAYEGSVDTLVANNNGTNGFGGIVVQDPLYDFRNITANDNAGYGIYLEVSGTGSAYGQVMDNVTCQNNTNAGILGNGMTIFGFTTSGNAAAIEMSKAGQAVVHSASMSEATKVTGMSTRAGTNLLSQREGGTSTVNKIYSGTGTIQSETSTKQAGALAWQLSPTSANCTSAFPLCLPIRGAFAKASETTTWTFWCRVDNTGISAQLRIPAGRQPGVGSGGTTPGANDIITTVNPAANTWTQYSITATPTEDCEIDILFEAWGGTTFSAFIDTGANGLTLGTTEPAATLKKLSFACDAVPYLGNPQNVDMSDLNFVFLGQPWFIPYQPTYRQSATVTEGNTVSIQKTMGLTRLITQGNVLSFVKKITLGSILLTGATTVIVITSSGANTVTVTITIATTLAIVKLISTSKLISSSTTALVQKIVNLYRSCTGSSAASRINSILLTRSASASSTATRSMVVSAIRTVTEACSLTVRKAISTTISLTESTSAAALKSVPKLCQAFESNSVTITKSALLTLLISSACSVFLRKTINLNISASVAAALSVARLISVTLLIAAASNTTIVKSISKSIAIAAGSALTVVKLITLSAFSAACSSASSVLKSKAKEINATADTAIALAKSVSVIRLVTEFASTTVGKVVSKTTAVTANSIAKALRTFFVTVSAECTSSSTFLRSYVVNVTATVSASPSVRKVIAHIERVTTSVSINIAKLMIIAISILELALVKAPKVFQTTIQIVESSSVVLRKQIQIQKTILADTSALVVKKLALKLTVPISTVASAIAIIFAILKRNIVHLRAITTQVVSERRTALYLPARILSSLVQKVTRIILGAREDSE